MGPADDSRVAQRRHGKHAVDGLSRPDGGVVVDDFRFLEAIGVMGLLEQVHGAAIHRAVVPFIQGCPALRGEDLVGD